MSNPSDLLTELIKPRNYLPKCLKIRTKEGELKPFVINDAQDIVLQIIEEKKKNKKPIRLIVLKARQMGISTLTEGLIFNTTATTPLTNSLIVAHEDAASQNLYNMYRTYYENLPLELMPMKKYSNAQELLFENPTDDPVYKQQNPGLMSRVRVSTAKNVNTGRSWTIHNLHASEVAFWTDAKTLMTGLMQSVPDTSNTMVVIESTANGIGGYFYEMWKAAEKGENDFTPVFLPWFTDKSYRRKFDTMEELYQFMEEVNYTSKDKDDNIIHTEEWEMRQRYNLTYEQLNWRRYTIANKLGGDPEMFCQEYPSNPDEAFIASGRPRFSITALKQYLSKCVQGIRGYLEDRNGSVQFVENEKGYVEIFKMPEEDRFYSIGADVAEGLVTGDYSCGIVGSDDFDVSAIWHGHIDPDLFGVELVKLARFYNDAYIGCERNNHGLTTLKAIQNEDYYNIYYQKIYDKIADQVTQKIGWGTDRRTKPLMINKLAEFVREKWLGIKSKLIIEELLSYVIEDDGSTNAQEGCHDDSVMALAILLQLILEGKGENFIPERTDLEPKKETKSFVPNSRKFDIGDKDEEEKDEIAL
jgi:hypothetical protein